MKRLAGLMVVLVGSLLTCGSALAACDTSGASFTDTFGDDRFAELWTSVGQFRHDDGKLVLEPDAGTSDVVISKQTFGEATICADVIISSGPASSNTVAGVVFWATDTDNYYTLNVDVNGAAYADALVNGKWKALATYNKSVVANAGAGSSNSIEVRTGTSRAEFFINGKRIGSVAGTPPADGQAVGLLASSPDEGKAEIVAQLIAVSGEAQSTTSDQPPQTDEKSTTDNTTSTDQNTTQQEETPAARVADYQPTAAQAKLFDALLKSTLEDPQEFFTFYDGKQAVDDDGRPMVAFEFDDEYFDDGYLDFGAFRSEADAAAYLAGDETSPFVQETAKWAGGTVQSGRIRDSSGREFYWAGFADKPNDEQWIGMAMPRGDMVITVWYYTFTDSENVEAAALDDTAAALGIGIDKLVELGF